MLRALIEPCAIAGDDKGAKPLQARMIRSFLLQIGQNLAQCDARHGPIVRALLQHEPRVTDRPANDFVNKSVHRDGPLPLHRRQPDEAAANAAPLT